MTGSLAEFLAGAPSRAILIDTNILLLYFVGTVDRHLIASFKRTARFAPEDYDTLLGLISNFDRVLTTPHVLAETSNFLEQVKGPHRDEFLAVFAAGIGALDERYSPSQTLAAADSFLKIGLTDTAILTAAADCVVLTDDATLYNFLTSSGVDAINFNHVRTYGWKP